MAVYFSHTCTTCGGDAANDDKTKSFVHADRGTKHNHPVGQPQVTRTAHTARCLDMGPHDHDAICFESTVVVAGLSVRV